MLGWRSLNLELLPLDPDIEKVFRKERRATTKMENNMAGNPHQPENEQHRAENVDHNRSLRDLFTQVTIYSSSCIVLPPTNATHFDLKPPVIQLLPSFHGLELENPYNHVKKFKDIYATFKFQNFSEESVHLRLFPFSLHDIDKAWLDSNMPGSITSWENLLNKFYSKFFLMSKVNEYRKEISSFTQEEDEKFSESWERFQEMLIKCSPHGYEKWRLIQFLYRGLTQSNR
jgi:predicted ribosome quality control (RQC) complex YloA/Tae2 family protein